MIFFRRGSFRGEFQAQEPKWHMSLDNPPKYGKFTALCGYTKNNILGDLQIKRSKKKPKLDTLCKKCLKEAEK